MANAKTWGTPKITEALRRRYPDPAFAFLEEVRNQTGYGGQERTADALALGLWPSQGMRLHGFEIKCSRSDWLKEMRDPSKSEAIMKYCDHWWLVVGSASIVKPSELPDTWGLLVPSGTGLKVKVDAPRLKDPKAMGRAFVASVLRTASRVSDKELAREYSKGWKESVEKAKSLGQQRYEGLRHSVEQFEKASGVGFNRYRAGHIGDAVKMVLDGKHLTLQRNIDGIRDIAKRVLKACDEEGG